MLPYLFISFVVLLALGAPIAVVLGASSVFALYFGSTFDMALSAQRMFNAVASFPLMAIPFFMLAGSLMEQGGISKRIIRFADALVGHLRGGLAIAGILACMIFAAISGSAVATVAAIGAIIIPEMLERGYSRGLATCTITAAGITGPIIPPSTLFVLYASIAGVSVTKMFLGGYIPGILMGSCLIFVVIHKAKKEGVPTKPKATPREIWLAVKDAIWALLSPVIIMAGILSGVCTPTEAGAVGCLYSFLVGLLIYRELSFKTLIAALKESAISSAIIMFLISTASIFSWILTVERVPQMITDLFMSITDNKYVLMMLITILLFIVGMLLDSAPAITMLVPVLLPMVKAYGIDPVFFGVVMTMNLCVGLLTPPVGTCLFVGCRVGKMQLTTLVKEIMPMLGVQIIVLLLCTFVEPIIMLLPRLLG